MGFRPDGDKVVFEQVLFRVQEDGSLVEIAPKVIVPQADIAADEENYQVGEGTPAGVIAQSTVDDSAAQATDDRTRTDGDTAVAAG